MAGSKTDLFENELLKLVTGQTPSASGPFSGYTPLTPWLALFTTAPTDSSGGTECTGTSYARINSTGYWGTPTGGVVTSNADLLWPTAGSGGWSALAGWGLMTASTSGYLVYYSDLRDADGNVITPAVPSGSIFKILSGQASITEL